MKYFRKHATQDKTMTRSYTTGRFGEWAKGAAIRNMRMIPSLVIVLGLSIYSATSATAGTLYDAQMGGWGSKHIDASRGFFLPGVVPATPRESDVRGLDASAASCRLRINAITAFSGHDRVSADRAREQCERRSISR